MALLAIFALAVGIGLFVLIAVVSVRMSGRKRRAWRDGGGAFIPSGYADDGGGDGFSGK